MNENTHAKGACLCGAIGLESQTVNLNVGACHCSTCRKWAGGPLLSVDCNQDVQFTGVEYISTFSSSDWAERGFCSACGTHLFYKIKQTNQYFIPIGLFDIDDRVKFEHQIFIDEKPAYYSFANDTKNMTGAEVFAAFSAGE